MNIEYLAVNVLYYQRIHRNTLAPTLSILLVTFASIVNGLRSKFPFPLTVYDLDVLHFVSAPILRLAWTRILQKEKVPGN